MQPVCFVSSQAKVVCVLVHLCVCVCVSHRAARRRGDYYLESYVPTHLLLLHLYAAQPEKPHIAVNDACTHPTKHPTRTQGYTHADKGTHAHFSSHARSNFLPGTALL